MSVTLTINDPTADEARALAVYFMAVADPDLRDQPGALTLPALRVPKAITLPEARELERSTDPVHAVIHGAIRERQEIGTLEPGAKSAREVIKTEDLPDTGIPTGTENISLDLASGEMSVDEICLGFGVPKTIDDPLDPASIFGKQHEVVVPNPPGAAGAATADGPNSAPSSMSAASPLPGAIEFDTKGMPWDARIHAGTKRKNADGSWSRRKGVAQLTVDHVEKEIRSVLAIAPGTPAAVPDPEQPTARPADPFGDFMAQVSSWVASKKLTHGDVVAACNSAGIATVNLVALRPDLVPAITADLLTRIKP